MSEGLSFSKFSTLLSCARKYKNLYIDKIGEESKSGDIHFGSALHAGINVMLEIQDLDAATGVFLDYWHSVKDLDLTFGRFKWEALKDTGEVLLSKFHAMHLKKYEPQIMEKRMYGDYQGLELEGTADFIGKYDGKQVLIDFKTTSQPYKNEKAAVSLQLYLYAYLAKTTLDFHPDELIYIPFNKATQSIQNPVIEVFSALKMKSMLDSLRDYAIMFKHQTQYPKNANSCLDYGGKCEFWEKCWGHDAKTSSQD